MASEKMLNGVRLMVTTNMSQREIAKELKVTENTITNWKKDPDFDKIRLQYEREYLGSLASQAIKTYAEILKHGNSEHVKYLVASDILDRTGHKPSENINMNANVNNGQLDSILEQLVDPDG